MRYYIWIDEAEQTERKVNLSFLYRYYKKHICNNEDYILTEDCFNGWIDSCIKMNLLKKL